MKSLKLSFDFSDNPELVELLRVQSATLRKTQKALLVEALEAYFADKLESKLILDAAKKSFAEWDNPEDEVYDTL